jgi:hypothetical protein
MDKITKLICLVGTLSCDPAGLAMCPPKLRIDAPLGIDRCDEDVRHVVVTIGATGFAGKRNAHVPELWR